MSFPRYSKYKSSGVEWLGDVPMGWEVKPLRSVFKFSKGLTITKEDLRDEGVCCVNYGEIHSKYGFRLNPDIHPLRCVEPEYLSSNPEALIRDGDFVFADTSEDLEGSGNFTHLSSKNPIFAGYHTIIARPRNDICSLLLAYQIHSSVFRSQIQRQVKGVKVFSISQGILKSAKCCLPPLPEQTAIAEFLDRETGKIDVLVAEQRRLMELLKEKRQAVISHAVTKGVNPHAPMKPSGIEWLGDVPEGWEVQPIKRLCSIISKGTTPSTVGEEFKSEGVRFIKAENITEAGVMAVPEFFISVEAHEILSRGALHSEDVLVVIAGATTGKSAVMKQALLPANTNQAVSYLRLKDKRLSSFINLWLSTSAVRNLILLDSVQAAQPNLSMEDLGNIPAPVPPPEEVDQVMTFLDSELAKFDTLTAEAQRAIDLLQERRTALISAAVTGQIDVRHQPWN